MLYQHYSIQSKPPVKILITHITSSIFLQNMVTFLTQ